MHDLNLIPSLHLTDFPPVIPTVSPLYIYTLSYSLPSLHVQYHLITASQTERLLSSLEKVMDVGMYAAHDNSKYFLRSMQ